MDDRSGEHGNTDSIREGKFNRTRNQDDTGEKWASRGWDWAYLTLCDWGNTSMDVVVGALASGEEMGS